MTAKKIDFGARGDGKWLDLDGDGHPEYSKWYGFGRIDAEQAVKAAISHCAPVAP
jgi:hypothetical protein